MITFEIKSNALKKKAEDALAVALDNELMEDEYGEESFADVPPPEKKGFFRRMFGGKNKTYPEVDLVDWGNQFKKMRIEEDIRMIRNVISTCEFAPPGSLMTIDSVVAGVLSTYTK